MKPISLALILFSQLSLAASYTVPVPADLYSEATWDGVTANASIASGTLTIYYHLPTDIVGTVSPIFTASGKVTNSSFISVSGKNVSGTCMKAKEKPLACLLKYPKSIVDEATRDQSLEEHFDGVQLEKKSAIARIFGADPAGFLMVELK